MLALTAAGLLFTEMSAQAQPPAPGEVIEEYSPEEYGRDMVAAELLTTRIPLEEILGPLAPLALSPFFALLCLSGASIGVSSGMLPENQLLMGHPVLSNPVVFWTLVALTLITGLPRLMKVSKIFAQTADFLETHAGIISYLLILVVAAQHHFLPGEGGPEQAVVISAGIGEFSLEVALMLACALNIFVINSVRFFFELLVLVCPIPSVDALFETVNKTLTAGLTLLYTFNPFAATIISLTLFGLCLIAYKFVHHPVQYYRSMLTTPLLVALTRRIWKNYDGPHTPRAAEALAKRFGLGPVKSGLWVYPDRAVKGVPKRAKCLFVTDGSTLLLVRLRFLRQPLFLQFQADQYPLDLRPGALAGFFEVSNTEGAPILRLNFSRAWNAQLEKLAADFGAQLNEGDLKAFFRNTRDFINGGLLQLGRGIAEHAQNQSPMAAASEGGPPSGR